jgi:hypothetical protein
MYFWIVLIIIFLIIFVIKNIKEDFEDGKIERVLLKWGEIVYVPNIINNFLKILL